MLKTGNIHWKNEKKEARYEKIGIAGPRNGEYVSIVNFARNERPLRLFMETSDN